LPCGSLIALFIFDHCIVCPSTYTFWLPLDMFKFYKRENWKTALFSVDTSLIIRLDKHDQPLGLILGIAKTNKNHKKNNLKKPL
jgi:hypothetical protein